MDYFNAPNLKTLLRNNLYALHLGYRRIAECVALGLGHIHEKGWIHRDVKPDNILMSKSMDIRMIDFSLAANAPNPLAKMIGMKSKTICGTRTYISPEVIQKYPATVQSDIYSYGVMLYECLTGKPPFMGGTPNDLLIKHIRDTPANPSDLEPNATPEMDEFIKTLLAKKPADRPKDMSEVISMFRSVKVFIEEPDIVHKKRKEKAEEDEKYSLNNRLTSRDDAERTTRGERPQTPKVAPPTQIQKPKKEPVKPKQTPQQPVQAQQVPPPIPPQQPYPPQNYPPQNYPPQNYPPQNYPPQGYPYQQVPGQPQGNYPPQNYPGQQHPPQQQPYPQQPPPPQNPPSELPVQGQGYEQQQVPGGNTGGQVPQQPAPPTQGNQQPANVPKQEEKKKANPKPPPAEETNEESDDDLDLMDQFTIV